MSDQAWAGLFQGLGRGMETFLALQQADHARKRQDALDKERQTRQQMEEYKDGWRNADSVPRVTLPGLSIQHTPERESFLPPTLPRRPDTAPVATDIIDPVRYDTRTGVTGKVFDRVENPAARAEAAKVREYEQDVQRLMKAGMAPNLAAVVASGMKVPEPPNPVAWQLTQDEQGTYQVHPHTGEARPVVAGGRQLKPRQPAPRSSSRTATTPADRENEQHRTFMLRRMGELTRGRGTPGRVGYVPPLSEREARDKAQREWDTAVTPAATSGAAPQAVESALEVLRSGRGTLQQLEQSQLAPEVIAEVKARWGQR